MRRHGLDWPLGFAFFGTALHPRCVGIASCWHCATLRCGHGDLSCTRTAARVVHAESRRRPCFITDAAPSRRLASLLAVATKMLPGLTVDPLHQTA